MKPSQLRAAGRRLFGEKWKSPLARTLGYGYVALHRMASEQTVINRTFELALAGAEAIKSGFRPSWWTDQDAKAFEDNPTVKKPTRQIAIKVE